MHVLRLSLPIRPARLAAAVTIAGEPPHLFTYVDVRKRLLQTLYITRHRGCILLRIEQHCDMIIV